MRYSDKESFNSCPFKYKLEKIDGLKKIEEGEDSHDKNWGAAIHEALRSHYQGKSWQEITESFLRIYPKHLKEDDLAKTPETGIQCLKLYREYYANQDTAWEILSTEEEGIIEIGGEEHELHVDLVARSKQSGDIYLWDHKTTGKTPSYTYWKAYELSGQISRYVSWCSEKYGSCSGAIINNITVGYRSKRYKDEPAGFWCKFERQIFNRSKTQLDYWRQSDEEWMRLIKVCEQTDTWPKALNKLCAWCAYYELCLSNNDEQIRELLYCTDKADQPSEKEKVA